MTPTTLKLTVQADKTMFGKKSGNFNATLGPWTVQAPTKEAAVEKLERDLTELDRHMFTRRYLVTPQGVTFALYHRFGGWAYDIVRHDGSASSCMFGAGFTEQSAFESMQRHYEDFCRDAEIQAA